MFAPELALTPCDRSEGNETHKEEYEGNIPRADGSAGAHDAARIVPNRQRRWGAEGNRVVQSSRREFPTRALDAADSPSGLP